MRAQQDLRPGGRLRMVLLAGVGGLLVLLLIAGLDALSTLHRLHADEEGARRDYLVRNQCLLEFRSTLDAYGNRIDEYFLDTIPDVQASAANDSAALTRRIQACVKSYPPQRGPQERDFLDAVQKML